MSTVHYNRVINCQITVTIRTRHWHCITNRYYCFTCYICTQIISLIIESIAAQSNWTTC